MPIQLDKILADIAEEKPLHPYNEASTTKKEQDEAWIKVAKKNKLSAHEAKSIFKVLQKKYEQEKLKASSTWKLYQNMEDICRQKEEEIKPKTEPEESAEAEDESFVEFLEVREDEEDYEGDSDNQDKSMKSSSSTGSPEKENNPEPRPEQKLLNTQLMVSHAATPAKPDYTAANPQPHQQQQQQKQVNAAYTNALQKKGISLRKAASPGLKPPAAATPNQLVVRAAPQQRLSLSDNSRSVILSEGMKRKLQSVEKREDNGPANKRSLINTSSVAALQQQQQQQQASSTTQTAVSNVEIKQEILEDINSATTSSTTNTSSDTAINVITIPANHHSVSTDLSNGITTLKSNGFNAQIGEIDFQKDIIFDNNPPKQSNATGEIINIGNFENQLPPTFFKNLCNSNRHEALGLYVANIMNRVTGKTAAKLEVNILKAIVEAQSDELAKL